MSQHPHISLWELWSSAPEEIQVCVFPIPSKTSEKEGGVGLTCWLGPTPAGSWPLVRKRAPPVASGLGVAGHGLCQGFLEISPHEKKYCRENETTVCPLICSRFWEKRRAGGGGILTAQRWIKPGKALTQGYGKVRKRHLPGSWFFFCWVGRSHLANFLANSCFPKFQQRSRHLWEEGSFGLFFPPLIWFWNFSKPH